MPSQTQSLDFPSLEALFAKDSMYLLDYGWVAVAGTVILGFGHEPLIASLAEQIIKETSSDEEKQVAALRKLREALLKASPLVGFPRSINGLSILQKAITSSAPKAAERLKSDKSLRTPIPLAERHTRGRAFFGRIYAQHTERVLASMDGSSGGDLGEFAVNCIYGDLVAETSILGAEETGMLEFAACLALAAAPQAKGHMYGAHNLGNNGADIRAVVSMVRKIAADLKTGWSDEDMDFFGKADKW